MLWEYLGCQVIELPFPKTIDTRALNSLQIKALKSTPLMKADQTDTSKRSFWPTILSIASTTFPLSSSNPHKSPPLPDKIYQLDCRVSESIARLWPCLKRQEPALDSDIPPRYLNNAIPAGTSPKRKIYLKLLYWKRMLNLAISLYKYRDTTLSKIKKNQFSLSRFWIVLYIVGTWEKICMCLQSKWNPNKNSKNPYLSSKKSPSASRSSHKWCIYRWDAAIFTISFDTPAKWLLFNQLMIHPHLQRTSNLLSGHLASPWHLWTKLHGLHYDQISVNSCICLIGAVALVE